MYLYVIIITTKTSIMESIYKEGAVFRSKNQKSFKVQASGLETISTFEAIKISGAGLPILSGYRNYNKDVFELEIQPTEPQKEIKKSLIRISNAIKDIAVDLEKMNKPDLICSLGGNVSLLKLQLNKIEQVL